MHTNIARDYLFPEFIYSADLPCDSDALATQVLNLKDKDPDGVKMSNIGGWQSSHYGHPYPDSKNPVLEELKVHCSSFVNDVCILENSLYTTDFTSWWININGKHSFNAPHCHAGCHLSGIFYVKVPENSGNLILMNTNNSSQNTFFTTVPERMSFTLTPQEGRFYVFPSHLQHFVSPSHSDQDRISIAYNFSLKPLT